MAILIIFRHGQSVWNLENKFTGWVDVELTEKGKQEAINAGEKLKPYHFDLAYASGLKRAQQTLTLALDVSGKVVPTTYNDALNERMYGDLQGLDKTETAKKYGDDQVKIWRRSFDIPPPNGESLKDTADRLLLDVPCSGLGVLRRNPDSKWKLNLEEIERVKIIQREILSNFSDITKVGGKMVYATCSILPSEGEEQVKWFLEQVGDKWNLLGEKRYSPETHHADGFYMALLERMK